ncbi:hypothetical protein O3P69_000569 [Scylla paramamosain]|uniref:Uncharacterized protein n=1 Tax=Scylla paramamosain TaxID=85552 RepID=A0AAW0UVC4_SCYPA
MIFDQLRHLGASLDWDSWDMDAARDWPVCLSVHPHTLDLHVHPAGGRSGHLLLLWSLPLPRWAGRVRGGERPCLTLLLRNDLEDGSRHPLVGGSGGHAGTRLDGEAFL